MLTRSSLVFFINIFSVFFAGGQTQSLSEDTTLVDNFKFLSEHIRKSIIYPFDAQINGIHGVVYVQFETDHSGAIIKNSVKTLFGLRPSCDREAERVIRSYNGKIEAYRGVAKTSHLLHVEFRHPDSISFDSPSHILSAPITTLVTQKGFKAKDQSWVIYDNKGFENPSGKIFPGDTVWITGWSAWSYFIQTKKLVGHVSHQALKVNANMATLTKILNDRSPSEEEAEQKFKEELARRPIDTLFNFSSHTAHLSLSSSKTDLFAGECTTITLAFNVRDDNQLRLQFYNLGTQLSKILASDLNVTNAFKIDNNIYDVVGEATTIRNQKYTTYKIYEAAFCPSSGAALQIPAVKLHMLLVKRNKKDVDKVAEFHSPAVSVSVKPLSITELSAFNSHKMIGDFTLSEKIIEKEISVGIPFTYELKLKGDGIIFPIESLKLKNANLNIELSRIEGSDTIINEILQSEKTFAYQITPLRPGTYDLGTIVNFTFFSPKKNTKETLRSTLKIAVKSAPTSNVKEPLERSGNFIAIDASQSMMVEDYAPNRLSVVKDGIKMFFADKTSCNIGIVTFAGDVHVINPDRDLSCYSNENLDSIRVLTKSGTAIGDAIGLACTMIRNESNEKKIVIIGDGDNTAGFIQPDYAAEIAKNYHIKIYAIGIGKKGKVPYGKDIFGRPCMIEDTFSDINFKSITQFTGGGYFHAANAEEIRDTLQKIFSR